MAISRLNWDCPWQKLAAEYSKFRAVKKYAESLKKN
jgi:hypothetical protein